MQMQTYARRISVLCSVVLLSSFALGQVITGIPPLASMTGGLDSINLANLNVHFAGPVVVNKPGRGMPFVYSLSFDNSIWIPATSQGTLQWLPVQNWGWRGISDGKMGFVDYIVVQTACPHDPGNFSARYTFIYHDNVGTPHTFGARGFETCAGPVTNLHNSPAIDNSGYVLTTDIAASWNYTVTASDGTVYFFPGIQGGTPSITDSNGNQLTATAAGAFTDTLGTQVLNVTGASPGPVTYKYLTPPGANSTGTAAVTVNYSTYTVQTLFLCPGIKEYGPASQSLVSTIVLADNSSYSFQYEATPGHTAGDGYVTGRLASITLPTGGTIQYTYFGGSLGINCSDGSTAGLIRTTSDGTTTYTRSQNSVNSASWNTTVTDAAQDQSVYTFSGIYETQRQIYQGSASSGTRVREQHSCYNGNQTNCESASVTGPITAKTTWTLMEGYQDKAIAEAYNGFGLLSQRWEYNDVALLRVTKISYAALGNNIVDRPAQVTVEDASGNQVSQTIYAYDDTPLTATSGVPQHVAINGSRGNLTHQTNVLLGNTDSSPISTYNYDDTGNLISIAGPGGQTTSLSYSPTLANAYVTQITAPPTPSVNHISSTTYDINTGLVTSSTDENGQVASFSYDSMLRPTVTTLPDGGQSIVTYYDPNTVLVQRKIDSSRWTQQWARVDGYGRTSRIANFNGESSPSANYDQQDFCYAPQGRQTFVTYPFQGPGWANFDKTCSVQAGNLSHTKDGDTTAADTLGRPTLVTHSDGTTIQYAYRNRATKVTEESNGSFKVSRISQRDSFGRSASARFTAGLLFPEAEERQPTAVWTSRAPVFSQPMNTICSTISMLCAKQVYLPACTTTTASLG